MRKPLGDFAQCSPLQRTLMITLALTDTPALTSLEKLFAYHPIHSSSGTQVGFCPLPTHIMATAPHMGSLPPSDLLLPPGQHFSGMISVHYSL